MVSHWSLSDSNSIQVSRSLFSSLADLNNAIIWMVSTHPLISKSTSSCTNPLVTVTRATITTGIAVTFMFHSFFKILGRSMYLASFSISFNFTLSSAGNAKSKIRQVLFFSLIITWSGRLDKIRRSVRITKFQMCWCVSFSRTDSGLYVYHLFVW